MQVCVEKATDKASANAIKNSLNSDLKCGTNKGEEVMSSFEFLRINSGSYRTIKKRDKMSKGMKAIPIHELQKSTTSGSRRLWMTTTR